MGVCQLQSGKTCRKHSLVPQTPFYDTLSHNTPPLRMPSWHTLLTHQVARSLVPVIVMAISMFYYGKFHL